MSATPTAAGGGADRPVTVRDFQARRDAGERLVMVSTYDALFARIADAGGVDSVLVGDSAGNVVAGFDTTVRVTLDHMIYHGAAVRRGLTRALLVVDMPFGTYHASREDAVRNCARVAQETGAQAVKLEGASEIVEAGVRAVVGMGLPVMGHLGFTPQSVHALGGFRVQGRGEQGAQALIDDARRLEDAGVFSLVLELVPAAVAARVCDAVRIPVIGIGAGAACHGQVLVLHDLLGLTEGFEPRFLKRYARLAADARGAVERFAHEVREGTYPDATHSF
ncbi:MAG TPA: 3-methyl-2-oxobutanoate hydroxymethyltransferase [Gemmatimonadaceae bacterium]|nr:3-methyl-2-oxobutanoate hydroxymethyltransferase [Gemmatimonadaceae bacterium]